MARASQEMQDLARELFALQAKQAHASDSCIDNAMEICGRLQIPLAKFAGPIGYSSLLSRALALAKSEQASLKLLRVSTDGALEKIQGADEHPQLSETGENPGVILVAQLLELLVTFIGKQLMMTLLCDAWPSESFAKTDPRTEEKS